MKKFKSVKSWSRQLLNKLGFDVVRLRNSNADFPRHLLNIFAAYDIDCVIDVGANAGQYGKFLREIGFKGQIVSFEPVSSVFALLELECASDDKWSCHKLALGDFNETKTINVYKSTVFSSFLSANDYSKKIWQSLQYVTTESVKVVRLDEIFAKFVGELGSRNCMLKLDTQGYDKYAFEGARGCLKQVRAVQSELSLIPVYEGMVEVYEVLREFNNSGFFISGMYPVNRDLSLAVIEYDCVLVKPEGKIQPR